MIISSNRLFEKYWRKIWENRHKMKSNTIFNTYFSKNMNTELTVSLPQAMTSLEAFEITINQLGAEAPEKAYLIANQMAKVSKKLQDNHKEWFQKYYDNNKELPGDFDCKVSEKKTFDFSTNEEWVEKKAELEALESILKNATEQSLKGNITMNWQGEVIEPIEVKFTEVYTVTRKK